MRVQFLIHPPPLLSILFLDKNEREIGSSILEKHVSSPSHHSMRMVKGLLLLLPPQKKRADSERAHVCSFGHCTCEVGEAEEGLEKKCASAPNISLREERKPSHA